MKTRVGFAMLLGASLVLGAAGCGDDNGGGGGGNGPYTLSFSGNGYAPHNGQKFEVALLEASDGSLVRKGETTVANGTFSLSWAGVLQKGVAYNLEYYADLSGNGECDTPPTDHAWRTAIPVVSGNVTIDDPHDVNVTNVCSTFGGKTLYDLSFSGTGFGPHNGGLFEIAVVKGMDGSVVKSESFTVANGEFDFAWDDLLEAGETYTIDYYADLDGSGSCDAPPTDHVWQSSIPAVSSDVSVDETHDTDFTDTCSSF